MYSHQGRQARGDAKEAPQGPHSPPPLLSSGLSNSLKNSQSGCSVGKVLALEAQGPEFDSLEAVFKNKQQTKQDKLVISAMGRPWDSPAS